MGKPIYIKLHVKFVLALIRHTQFRIAIDFLSTFGGLIPYSHLDSADVSFDKVLRVILRT